MRKIHLGSGTGNLSCLMVSEVNEDIKNDCLFPSNLPEKEGQF